MSRNVFVAVVVLGSGLGAVRADMLLSDGQFTAKVSTPGVPTIIQQTRNVTALPYSDTASAARTGCSDTETFAASATRFGGTTNQSQTVYATASGLFQFAFSVDVVSTYTWTADYTARRYDSRADCFLRGQLYEVVDGQTQYLRQTDDTPSADHNSISYGDGYTGTLYPGHTYHVSMSALLPETDNVVSPTTTFSGQWDFAVTPVPEPGSLALLAASIPLLVRRKRR